MSRLREGRANTARGAAHFLRETVGRVRYAGANGRLTLRADSGFYTHGVVSVCRKMMSASPSPSASKSCAISSRRYQRMPGLPFPTGWTAPPRSSVGRHVGLQLSRRAVRAGPIARWSPRRQRRLAGGTGDGPQHRPLDSAHRSGRGCGDHQDPPAAVLLPGRTDHPLGAPPHTASATALALGSPVRSCPGPIARPPTPCLTAAAATGRHPANRTSPRPRASPVCECLLLRPLPARERVWRKRDHRV